MPVQTAGGETATEQLREVEHRPKPRRTRSLAGGLTITGIWLALSLVLGAVTTQVRDWFAMTNELLYELRAINVAQTHSPLPAIHGVAIRSYDQLYPLLLAPAFARGLIAHDLETAHFLNAMIMASACIPAYLLAQRVTATRWVSLVVAVLTVVMPWIVFASFLMTEVAAYPAFLWAVFLIQRALEAPSRRNDVGALLGIALAFTARTQLGLLAVAPPVAILALELGRAPGPGAVRRLRRACGLAVSDHQVLAAAYALFAVTLVALKVAGHVGSMVGVYGQALGGELIPHGTAGSLVSHVSTLAIGVGILPLVVGLAWLSAGVVRPTERAAAHVFACLGTVVFVVMVTELTVFDLRFGGAGGFVHDRYLIYLLPIVVLGYFCALLDRRRPRWSLVAPTALVALGFVFGAPQRFLWQQFAQLNSDAPILFVWRPIVRAAHGMTEAQVSLVVVTLLLTGLFALGNRYLSHRSLTAIATGLAVVVMPLLTVYMFDRLLGQNSWSGRPVTRSESGVFDWVDRSLGTRANVTIVPYALSDSYFLNQQEWRDIQFWNKSVTHVAQYLDPYAYRFTDPTFPKIMPTFNPRTGLASISPTPYVIQAVQDSRFRLSGNVQAVQPSGMALIDADRPWRTDWLSSGLYDDGWTKPGVTTRVRVFAAPGQRRAVYRALQFGFRSPDDVARRPVQIASNAARWSGTAVPSTTRQTVEVCVPAHGYSDVSFRALGSSEIPGSSDDFGRSQLSRRGGVFLAQIALADEIGKSCMP